MVFLARQALIMGILRALLLSFSFALAVKMGLGSPAGFHQREGVLMGDQMDHLGALGNRIS